ncbi:restriction endonuclease subunit S [Helicobacter pylori]|uniref:restriction endonuclease subunit S n=1 Tax=Helicobacter pylori TaxID=210 RepID=UPI000FDEBD96|nr:restriction endonuclease subunit S [Helicobacter pylori]RVY24366.1 restriction endonuclease subunit S [Helicobacter pylori]
MDALTTPSNWQRVRLGDILSYEQPTKYLVATTQYLQKGFTPILTAGKTFILGYTNDKHGIYTNIPVIIFDDFTTDSKMVNFPFKVKSSAIKILSLRDNNQADLKYIYEKLTLLKHQVTDHKRYWIDEFSNIEIPLPPLNEQIAIANVLSGLDHYLYTLDALILKKESVKKALSFELLSQRKRLKGFNQNWQRVRLGDICEFGNGGAYETLIVENGDFKLISLNSIDIDGNLKNTMKRVNFYDNSLKQDDIVMVLSDVAHGDFLGLCAVIPSNDYVLNQRMGRLRKRNDCINILFLRLYINANQKYFKMQGQGSSQLNLSKKAIEDFEIFLPPLNEQIAIANILSALDSEIISLKNKKCQFENIKKALNHDLMSAKIRVLNK